LAPGSATFGDLERRLAEALAGKAEALRDKAEAQEQQRATSEVLRTIAHTQSDMQPVLDALTASATRLCDAVDAYIFRVGGQGLRLVAHHGPIAGVPIGGCLPLVRETVVGRTVLDARTVHVADVQTPPAAAGSRQTGLPGDHDPLQMAHLDAAELRGFQIPQANVRPSPF